MSKSAILIYPAQGEAWTEFPKVAAALREQVYAKTVIVRAVLRSTDPVRFELERLEEGDPQVATPQGPVVWPSLVAYDSLLVISHSTRLDGPNMAKDLDLGLSAQPWAREPFPTKENGKAFLKTDMNCPLSAVAHEFWQTVGRCLRRPSGKIITLGCYTGSLDPEKPGGYPYAQLVANSSSCATYASLERFPSAMPEASLPAVQAIESGTPLPDWAVFRPGPGPKPAKKQATKQPTEPKRRAAPAPTSEPSTPPTSGPVPPLPSGGRLMPGPPSKSPSTPPPTQYQDLPRGRWTTGKPRL